MANNANTLKTQPNQSLTKNDAERPYPGGRLQVDVFFEDNQRAVIFRGLYQHAKAAGLPDKEAGAFAEKWTIDKLQHHSDGKTRPYTDAEFKALIQKGVTDFDLDEKYSLNVLNDLRQMQAAYRLSQVSPQTAQINVASISAPEYTNVESVVKWITDTIQSATGSENEIGKQFNRLSVSSLRLMGQIQEMKNRATEAVTDVARDVAPDSVDQMLDSYDKANRQTAQALKNANTTVTSNDTTDDLYAAKNGIKRPLAEDLHRKMMYFPEGIPNAVDSAIKGDFKKDDGTYSVQVGKIIGSLNPAGDIRDISANVKNVINGEKGSGFMLGATIVGAIPGGGDVLKPILKKLGKEIILKEEKEIIEKAVEDLVKNGVEKETAEKLAKDEVPRIIKAEKELIENREQFKQIFGQERYNGYAGKIEAEKMSRPEIKDIPTEDLVAIKGYTSEDYKMLNEALRSKDSNKIKAIEPYIKVAESGLEQLPNYNGVVYRGVDMNKVVGLAEKYSVGNAITEEVFTSSSVAKGNAFRRDTLMIIESKSGKDVSFLSDYPKQKEILFKPGTKFEVEKVFKDRETGKTVISLKEVE